MPASIQGVTRSAPWVRTELWNATNSEIAAVWCVSFREKPLHKREPARRHSDVKVEALDVRRGEPRHIRRTVDRRPRDERITRRRSVHHATLERWRAVVELDSALADTSIMWMLDDADDSGSRVLHSDVDKANKPTKRMNTILTPQVQEDARDAPTRAAMKDVLQKAIRSRINAGDAPDLTYDDLDRIRASLGGAPFQHQQKVKRAP